VTRPPNLAGRRATEQPGGEEPGRDDRADPTGSDSTNQALSRYRAEAVLGALAARGVPSSAASLRAIGTSRPLPSSDPEERARINRSVSFHVSLGVGPGREPSR